MLSFFKIERNAALLLLIAAVLGLSLANSPWASGFNVLRETSLTIPFANLHLSLSEWLGEGLMTGFFLLIGLELKREATSGALTKPSAILIPGFAALIGAIVPALVFVCLVTGEAASGWPIPMATDVTFALAVFAVFGKHMPRSSRAFLLSFAVIDDLIAILVIAIFLTAQLNIGSLLLAAASLAAFAVILRSRRAWVRPISVIAGILAWYFTLESGVSPLVTGVILGLLVPAVRIEKLETALHPWVSLAVLPLFALFAAGVSLGGGVGGAIGEGSAGLTEAAPFVIGSALSIAILLRPVGKILGITAGALLGRALARGESFTGMRTSDYLRISVLGGIGFTVALLVANSVYGASTNLATTAIVATLIAMVISMVVGAWALSSRKSPAL
jgi:NhaA family Na+:H+ antiporter